MAGGTAYLLHHLYQRTGDKPEDVWNQPRRIRDFKLASMQLVLEQETEGR